MAVVSLGLVGLYNSRRPGGGRVALTKTLTYVCHWLCQCSFQFLKFPGSWPRFRFFINQNSNAKTCAGSSGKAAWNERQLLKLLAESLWCDFKLVHHRPCVGGQMTCWLLAEYFTQTNAPPTLCRWTDDLPATSGEFHSNQLSTDLVSVVRRLSS